MLYLFLKLYIKIYHLIPLLKKIYFYIYYYVNNVLSGFTVNLFDVLFSELTETWTILNHEGCSKNHQKVKNFILVGSLVPLWNKQIVEHNKKKNTTT